MQLNPGRPPQAATSIDADEKAPQSKPLHSMEELLHWTPGQDDYNVSNTPLYPRPYVQASAPQLKVIVCHDMAGGYSEDAATQGNNFSTIYSIQTWRYIDTFIYFSHNRVTIPPPCWTNAAHRNGVKSLGTFITEWKPGVLETDQLVSGPGAVFEPTPPKDPNKDPNKDPDKDPNKDPSKDPKGQGDKGGESDDTERVDRRFFSKVFADKLVDVAVYYKFDGWLINIESVLRGGNAQAKQMVAFLSYLRQQIHARIPGGELIWYDSVVYPTGKLHWQDGLTEKNKPFFEQSDGIFTNYTWDPPSVKLSIQLAGNRRRDVYTGIDIWGRGTFGGGGFYSYKALELIKREGTSVAMFAPGYIYENLGPADFLVNDRLFWSGFSGAGINAEGLNKIPKLPPPPPPPPPPPGKEPGKGDPNEPPKEEPALGGGRGGGTDEENFLPIAALVEGRPSGCKTWFYTDFDRGFGSKIFINGKAVRTTPWSNLSRQSLPPNMANDVSVLQRESGSDSCSSSGGAGSTGLMLETSNLVRWILSPDDAYHGGTSILIERVEGAKHQTLSGVERQATVAIPLYDTQISLADSAAWSVELVYKRLQPGVQLALYMGIHRQAVENEAPISIHEKARWGANSPSAPMLISQKVGASSGPSTTTSLIALDVEGVVEGGVQTTQGLENGWHKVVVSLTGLLQHAGYTSDEALLLLRHGSFLAQLGVTLTFPSVAATGDEQSLSLALLGSLAVLPLNTLGTSALFALRVSDTSMKLVRRQPQSGPAADADADAAAVAGGQTQLQVWSTLDWDIGYPAVPQNRLPDDKNGAADVFPTDYSHFNIYLTYEPRSNSASALAVDPVYVGMAFATKYRIAGANIALSPSSALKLSAAWSAGGDGLESSPFRLVAWVQGVRRHGRLDPQEEWISRELS
ncbi:hypothetical protein DFQ26_001494 [Actinomortierella ambigua]|nr:hypothetical protein DFQ26_001494 [Actinomortierella ambigua]